MSELAQALWALFHASGFSHGLDCLLAVNASHSVLATYGALAGALFGYSALPPEWCNMLHRAVDMETMARDLCRLSQEAGSFATSVANKGSSAAGCQLLQQARPGSRA